MKKILIVSFNDAGNEAQALRHITCFGLTQ